MAKGGGGAWKVAYADFVTAMMAFFLVMWICAQDQKVKKAVADYFNGRGELRMGSPTPARTGGAFDGLNTGAIPHSEAILMGRGRDSHSPQRQHSRSTKLVSDWVNSDDKAFQYWKQQAARQRELALRAKDSLKENETVEKVATIQLARQMKDELTQNLFGQAKGLSQDLLYEAIATVNWIEVAEDLLNH
jgi:flagellar motor protein MotB